VTRSRLLLVPFVTELEWESILPELEKWADVATCDPPGVGEEPLPDGLTVEVGRSGENALEMLREWRTATAERVLAEVDRKGWEEFFVVGDSFGIENAVRVAEARPEAVRGIALGHAALEHNREGDRPTLSPNVLRSGKSSGTSPSRSADG